jgi:undecaprenyl-diphosphatase
MNADGTKADPPSRLQSDPLLHDHPVAMRIALGLWVFSALLFIAIAIPTLKDAVQAVDDQVHRWVVSIEWGPAVTASQFLDFVGSAWIVWPTMAGVAGWLAWSRRWEAFSTWVVAMVVSQLMIGPVKGLYMRPRPTMSLVETSSWSFPSGHAVVGGAIAIAAVIVLVPAGPKRRNLELLAIAFAVVMALSRVYLRAHWLSDAVAGVALGAAIALGAAAVTHLIDEHWHSHSADPEPTRSSLS